MLSVMLIMALIIFSLSMLGCMYRVFKGPTMPDRIIALDSVGIHLIAIVAILSMVLRTQGFLDIILLIGILAFLGTIAYSKFLERGVVIEDEGDR